MLPFNIDFFNNRGEFVANSNASGITIETDYISGGDNTLTIINKNNASAIKRGGYVHLFRRQESYFGYITGITEDKINNATIDVKWTEILSVFNVDWCIDTDVQHSGTALETFMAQQMQQIASNVLTPGGSGISLQFETTSSTTDWGFNLKSDQENMHHTIVNFKTTIINRALKEYDVAVKINPVLSNSGIILNIQIGKISTSPKTIEVDIANIISKSLTLHDAGDDINRLTVYNEQNYNQSYTFYPGEDGTIYRKDQDNDVHQQHPVIYEVTSKAPGNNFLNTALAEAQSTFKQASYIDLIEIEVANSDTLINPLSLDITTIYNVIFNGVNYVTVLTGKKTKQGTTVITFGTNRLDLTKILRQRR